MAKHVKTETRIAHIPPFGLRMLPDLKARIEAAAKANGRSLNSEITARLEWSLQPGSGFAVEDVAAHSDWLEGVLGSRVEEHERRIAALEKALGVTSVEKA